MSETTTATKAANDRAEKITAATRGSRRISSGHPLPWKGRGMPKWPRWHK